MPSIDQKRRDQLRRCHAALDAGRVDKARAIFFEGIEGFLERLESAYLRHDAVMGRRPEHFQGVKSYLMDHPGATTKEVVAACCCSRESVFRARHELKLKAPRPLDHRFAGRNLLEKFRALLAQYPGQKHIVYARMLNCSDSHISYMIRLIIAEDGEKSDAGNV